MKTAIAPLLLWLSLLSLPAPAAPVPGVAAVRAAVDEHNTEHGAAMLREFRDFLSLPNVSGDGDDMRANAAWIEAYLAPRGFASRTVDAGRAPYVLAERTIDEALPTVLVYAHFDGQPVEPANWASPPFTPTLKDPDRVLDWDEALKDTAASTRNGACTRVRLATTRRRSSR